METDFTTTDGSEISTVESLQTTSGLSYASSDGESFVDVSESKVNFQYIVIFFSFCFLALMIASVVILWIGYSSIFTPSSLNNTPSEVKNERLDLSLLGLKIFDCEGTCVCNDNSGRRIAGTMSGKSLSIAIAAGSAILAMNYAKRFTKDECISMYSDSCSSDSIESNVQFCDESKESSSENTDSKVKGEVKEERFHFFKCSASCHNKNLWKEDGTEFNPIHLACQDIASYSEFINEVAFEIEQAARVYFQEVCDTIKSTLKFHECTKETLKDEQFAEDRFNKENIRACRQIGIEEAWKKFVWGGW